MRFRSLRAIPILLLPTLAFAWNAEGHKQIADIAWAKLTPKTKTAVERILAKADPMFAADYGNEKAARNAFRMLSTMPDVIKGNRNTAYESLVVSENGTWNVEGAGREGDRCKTWHYYDLPIRFTGAQPVVRDSNAVNALNRAGAKLATMAKAGDSSLNASWYLGWIEHVVGDLHQPLHCTSNYEVDHEDGDAGGNGVKLGLTGSYGRPQSLHAYWDEGIDHARETRGSGGRGKTSIERTTGEWLADPKLLPPMSKRNDFDPMHWVRDGARLADLVVYAPEIKDGAVPSPAYEARHRELCERQAVLGGMRLATVLNAIFDPKRS